MRSFLKSSTYPLEEGEPLVIRELSAGGRQAVLEATRGGEKSSPRHLAAVAVQASVPEFSGMTVAEVLAALPDTLLFGLAAEVYRLSGIALGSEADAEKN